MELVYNSSQSEYFNPLAPRGARLQSSKSDTVDSYFNPLAPRGARRCCELAEAEFSRISIH